MTPSCLPHNLFLCLVLMTPFYIVFSYDLISSLQPPSTLAYSASHHFLPFALCPHELPPSSPFLSVMTCSSLYQSLMTSFPFLPAMTTLSSFPPVPTTLPSSYHDSFPLHLPPQAPPSCGGRSIPKVYEEIHSKSFTCFYDSRSLGGGVALPALHCSCPPAAHQMHRSHADSFPFLLDCSALKNFERRFMSPIAPPVYRFVVCLICLMWQCERDDET